MRIAALEASLARANAALAARDLLIDTLRGQIARLRRMQFGASSEKLGREIEQLELALEELETQRDVPMPEVAASGVKALIDVGRPFLDFVVSALADVGVTEICLVVGPEHAALREYAKATSGGRVTVTTAIQAAPRGTADAVAAARDFAGDQRVLVLNSDNYYPREALAALVDALAGARVGEEGGVGARGDRFDRRR